MMTVGDQRPEAPMTVDTRTSNPTSVSPAANAPAETAAVLSRNPGAELIDVRTPAEYEQIHAQGARLVPLHTLDPNAILAARSDADAPLFVICRSGGRSAKAVEQLRAAGCMRAVSVEGGTDAWEQSGLPVVRGKGKTISLERQVRIVAGLIVLLGASLAWWVHPAFVGICAFIGAGLTFAGVTDWCGMGMLLARMPWNNQARPQ